MMHGTEDHKVPFHNSAALFSKVLRVNVATEAPPSRRPDQVRAEVGGYEGIQETCYSPARAEPTASAVGSAWFKTNPLGYKYYYGYAQPKDAMDGTLVDYGCMASCCTDSGGDGGRNGEEGGSCANQSCTYHVELHKIRGASHNNVHKTRNWLAVLPTFVVKAEAQAAAHLCYEYSDDA